VLRAEKKGKVGFSGLFFLGYFLLEEQKKVTYFKKEYIIGSVEKTINELQNIFVNNTKFKKIFEYKDYP
jgi:hypothetical protein